MRRARRRTTAFDSSRRGSWLPLIILYTARPVMSLPEPAMNAAVSLFSRAAHRSVARASCPAEVRDLAMEFAPLGADFLLLLVDECLDLVEAWRLARREGSGVQGFPISIAIGLALRARATGMIVPRPAGAISRDPS